MEYGEVKGNYSPIDGAWGPPSALRMDRWYLTRNTREIYSCKEGYKELARMKGRWMPMGGASVWTTIWELDVQPRIKIFLWWALSRTLQVASNLQTNFVPISEECLVCQGGPESTLHLFFLLERKKYYKRNKRYKANNPITRKDKSGLKHINKSNKKEYNQVSRTGLEPHNLPHTC